MIRRTVYSILLMIAMLTHAVAASASIVQKSGIFVSFFIGLLHGLTNNGGIEKDHVQKQNLENHSFMWADKREIKNGLIFLTANEIITSTFNINDDRILNILSHGIGQLLGEVAPINPHHPHPELTMNLTLFWGMVQKSRNFLFT